MNSQAVRTGWNVRGGSRKDDLEHSRTFWENKAMLKIRDLREMLGDDYPVFAEMIFPGDSIDHMSWQAIDISLSNWLASGKAAIFDSLECTCRPDGDACPVCRARARVGSDE